MNASGPEKEIESILCVEDDSIGREYLGKMLRLLFPDRAILSAENGQAGLDLFRRSRPLVVVTDVSMPVMDGVEMARQIRHLEPQTQIIALTAHSGLKEYLDDPGAMFDHLLLKPVRRNELREAVVHCLTGRVGGETVSGPAKE